MLLDCLSDAITTPFHDPAQNNSIQSPENLTKVSFFIISFYLSCRLSIPLTKCSNHCLCPLSAKP